MGELEGLFDGPATGLPALISNKAVLSRGTAQYRLAAEEEAPVKHLAGYAPFVMFCESRGVSAGQFATDVSALLAFLRTTIGDISAEPGLSESTTIFVGNVIAAMRPDAHWRVMADGAREVGTRGMMITVDRLMDGLPEADDGMVAGLLRHLTEWADEESDGPALPPLRPVPTGQAAELYVRPELPSRQYRHAEGQEIEYGNRWGSEGPPADAYSVETHGERFEGLHLVAHALIEYLGGAYYVDVSRDPAHAADVSVNAREVIDVARLTPRDPLAAPLTFVLTSAPGVVVRAGVLHNFPFPVCGCDACDETAESEATRLEELSLAVAAGGYGERYPVGRKKWAEYALFAADGSGNRRGAGPRGATSEQLAAAEERLRDVPDGWRAWPLR
ncbi:DUF6226 family protein [Paenarthrobacter aurescens]|uniref:Uncharacterized protein n=1 Tax=Paenarthrobacter aurescens TaxID=43663 RepID=A0A4Y3NPF8_PAEAU|nr:DUF6226 family protein [Paenarthrobacter aurescens]MDO6142452.1 DUF6226 family protein [Paenarthrobacter aurescens]MDO6146299.1 DUF6226 family protein [Paenarthrobacter aurescens]MDO6157544.1 DUF6226 family protein [Paenarthrobacter aurescens]MDO6161529.1 DUF6226 family protein [Paenarthrobacter aurescens]GEB20639.1 hypothetical protein AAU01_33940 [Paenarthrobacter aurescens]